MDISIFSGRLTRDPESRSTANGTSVCNFAVALNKGKDLVEYRECTAWEDQADFIMQYFKKGKPIELVANKKVDSWNDKTTGEERSRDVYTVLNVSFSPGGSNGTGNGGEASEEPVKDKAKAPSRKPKAAATPQPKAETFSAVDDEDDDSIPF